MRAMTKVDRAELGMKNERDQVLKGTAGKMRKALERVIQFRRGLNAVLVLDEHTLEAQKEKLPPPIVVSLKKRFHDGDRNIYRSINAYSLRIHHWARSKGWWKRPQGDVSKKLLMMHSEISEATEDLRTADPRKLNRIYWEYDKHGQLKPIGFASELADLIIRACDLAARLDIDLDAAVQLKMRFNEDRPYQHGGKKL